MSDTKKILEQHVTGIVKDLEKVYRGELKTEDGETMDMWDYFDDALDIEYRCGADRKYKSVEVLVAWGGPNVWVDTARGGVFGAWGFDRAEAYFRDIEVIDEIDSLFEELFTC